MTELERRKKFLEDTRDLRKPVSDFDFDTHRRQYEEQKLKRLEELQGQRQKEFE